MRLHKGIAAAAAAAVGLLAAGVASAQPRLENPSGGIGNAEMDHGRMGGQGAGSPAGGRITGSSGDGPEVQHGHAPMPERRQGQRR